MPPKSAGVGEGGKQGGNKTEKTQAFPIHCFLFFLKKQRGGGGGGHYAKDNSYTPLV